MTNILPPLNKSKTERFSAFKRSQQSVLRWNKSRQYNLKPTFQFAFCGIGRIGNNFL
jgi:hypothetical protein